MNLKPTQVCTSTYRWLIGTVALAIRLLLLPFESADYHNFISPWLEHIRSHNYIWALKDAFYDYNPPYLYLLTLLTYLPGAIPDIAIVKLPSILFDFIAALIIAKMVMLATSSQLKSRLAFGMVLFSPTLVLNSSFWGQCDIIYSSFLVLTVLLLIGQRPKLACISFGCALSFKLQALFLAPFLMWALVAGMLRFFHLFLIPIIFFISLLPALFLGRSFTSLLSIYLQQSKSYQSLSMNAPNLYHWIPDQHYNLFVPAGFLLASAFVLISSWLVLEKKTLISGHTALLFAFTSAVAMPFFLPKMHERYFFTAELLSIPLILSRPRWAPLYALLQLVSISTYFNYLFGKPILGPGIGAMLICGIVFFTLVQFAKEPSRTTYASLPALKMPSFSSSIYTACYALLFVSIYFYFSKLIMQGGISKDHPRLYVADQMGAIVKNEFLSAYDINQDWGQAKEGKSVDRENLIVGGIPYKNGIGVHAKSSMKFKLAGKYQYFEGKVGIPDYLAREEPTSVRFSIKHNESILWSSPIMNTGSPIQSFRISVSQIDTLELVADDAGNGNYADHGAWVDLKLIP